MWVAILISGFVIVWTSPCRAQSLTDFKDLYDAHRWNELDERLQNTEGMPLYRGALGVTFNQDPQTSERLLLSVISDSPYAPEAYEASEWLSHLYFYRGQYRSLVSIMETRWAAFPGRNEKQEKSVINGFRGLPNQILESTQPSQVTHERGSIFIPLSINNNPATYFFDTGAWISCMSESEAKRLGLKVNAGSGSLGQSAGFQVGFRTAVAQDVVVGSTHFKDVSFAVFPDSQEPWRDLHPGRRGIIGMPILINLQTMRWKKAGLLELAEKSPPFNIRQANLSLDNDHLVVTAIIENQTIKATVDTGAISTDLYKPFADSFDSLLKQYGKKGSTKVRGVGHAETFRSVTLPQLRIQVGGLDTVLSPVHVLLKSLGANCCLGNFGMDLFKQGSYLLIDFNAMKLQLGPSHKAH